MNPKYIFWKKESYCEKTTNELDFDKTFSNDF